ncbi:MAG: glutathione S-transferase family protein [Phenylobacterium sp.]|uniref:glutathione S-transferase family protein n=2 Tax=Phenylobacterium sp. TaxID=1871053 RepID=UPI002724656B|nr:glutathione S-transferase family protein [Phenylobacterium sp.]MDO8913757.1 glutathione S-transferase family protein [Phenylobacterium sp.]MDP3100634.1 glutathione S-transferase family protein [Phenylobacterium sp.]HQT54703.1 glutathione S-transferase family protein [Phenylobacterium sp.]
MKLYSGDLSPYSAKVRMQIYAKGISDIAIELPPGFMTGEFHKTSPLARIPVLDLGGDVIPESEVISEYLEEIYPQNSMLGATPRETAAIRTVSRIADIYLMNNMFMLSGQGRASTRSADIVKLLSGQVIRGIKALEHYIGTDGFAVSGRLTMADCTLVPALFLVENVIPTVGVEDPIPASPKVAAYWAAIQKNPHAAATLVELHRGLAERRDLIAKMAAKEKAKAAEQA